MVRALRIALLISTALACAPGQQGSTPPSGPPSDALTSCPPAPPAPPSARIIYTGMVRGSFGDALALEAMVSDVRGIAIAGGSVRFSMGSSSAAATTDAAGVARATLAPDSTGALLLTAAYAGDATHPPAQATATVRIERADTAIRYTGPVALPGNAAAPLSASLLTVDGAPVAGRTVVFQSQGASVQAVTDATGSARVAWPAGKGNGPAAFSIAFAGDAGYERSQTTTTVTLYQQVPFVVWGGNLEGLRPGAHVNFWGANWSGQVRSGDYAAGSSFKGYAGQAGAFAICQPAAHTAVAPLLDATCWSGKPGNGVPPATLPSWMGVMVSTAIAADAHGMVYGNIAGVALIKLDSASTYGPNPGHAGWGTLVSMVQPAAGPSLQATQSQPLAVLPGQPFDVSAHIANLGPAAAAGVAVNEDVGSSSVGFLGAGEARSIKLSSAARAVGARRDDESSDEYAARLGAEDGRRVPARGIVTYAGPDGQPYAPLPLHSASALQLPRLTLQLAASGCVGPGDTVNYDLTATNVGSAPAAGVAIALRLPDGVKAVIPLGSIDAGAVVHVSRPWTVPAIAPRGTSETNSAYLARLQAADAQVLNADASVTWTDAAAATYGPIDAPGGTKHRVPVLTVSAQPAPTLAPGQSGTLSFSIANVGSANAYAAKLTVTAADGATSSASVDKLVPGDSATVQVQVRAPSGASDGSAAQFSWSLVWTDARKDGYGPVNGTVSVAVARPVLAISIQAPASAGPGQSLAYGVTVQNTGHADASGISLTATLPDGSSASAAPAAVAAGASTQVQFNWQVPVPAAKGATESNEAYAARLQALDGVSLVVAISAAYADAGGNSYVADPAGAASVERVPVLGLTFSGPAAATGGDTIQYQVATSNAGSTAAVAVAAAVTLPDGSTRNAGLPSTVAPGATLLTPVAYVIPHAQPAGNIFAQVSLTWQDALGNVYGALQSSATTAVAPAASLQVYAGPDQTISWPPPPPQRLELTQRAGSVPLATGVSARSGRTVVAVGGGLSLVADDGTVTSFGSLSDLNGSLVQSAAGDVYAQAGAGRIARVAADGNSATDPWALLPGEQGAFQESFAFAPDGSLYAAATSGNLWRIDGAGQATLVTSSAHAWAGAAMIPADPRWGPLAGKLATTAAGSLYAIDAGGAVSGPFALAAASPVIALHAVPAAARFVGLDDSGALWSADASAFAGDLLLADRDGEVFDLGWDNTAGSLTQRSIAAQHQQLISAGPGLGGDLVSPPGDANVYWLDNGCSTVMKAPKNGGPAVTLASELASPGYLAADSTNVYYTDTGDGSVWKVSTAGGNPVALATNQASPTDIVADASNVYWANAGDGTFWKAPISGGAATLLAVNPTGNGTPYYYLEVDSTYLYWQTFGAVYRVSIAGGPVATLYADASIDPADLVIHGGFIYMTNYVNGTVMKMPVSGGTPVVLASGIDGPNGIAVDDTYVYWTTWPMTPGAPGLLMRVPVGGGVPAVLAQGETLNMMAIDANAVYWTDWDGGSVSKMPLAGPTQWTSFSLDAGAIPPLTATAQLSGVVTVTGNPSGSVALTWSAVSGPGQVTFGAAGAAQTSATFSAPGDYVLQLSATAGDLGASSTVAISVVP